MKCHWTVKAAAVVAILAMAPAAFAEWDLNWYADLNEVSEAILDSDGITPIAEGGVVYLIWDVNGDGIQGINADGTMVADDVVVLLDGGEVARVPIGQDDFPPFNDQGPGEFNRTSTLADTYQGENLYAIAFNTWVAYSGGQFVGFGLWGATPVGYTPDGTAVQEWDAGDNPWTTDQQLIPEPATVAMMVAGIGGMMAYRRKRKSQA